MTDFINVEGLRVKTRIGVTDEERATPQNLRIDITVQISATEAARSDDVAHTVDYDSLVNEVVIEAENTERRLLERLASDICDLILGRKGVLGVTVEVAKENPPVRHDVGNISVRMERRA